MIWPFHIPHFHGLAIAATPGYGISVYESYLLTNYLYSINIGQNYFRLKLTNLSKVPKF
jgi:hypothetical protein